MRKKKSKGKIIALSIIAVIVTAVTVGVVMNINNIAAVYRFLRYSESDIQSQLADTKNSLLDSIKDYGFTDNLRDFTEEEEKMLSKGELTPEEAVDLIFNSSKEEPDIKTEIENTSDPASDVKSEDTDSISDETPVNSNSPEEDEIEVQMKEYIKALYTVKADFTAKLGEVEKNVKADYSALAESERTLSGKQKIVMKYWNQIVELEKECDNQIDELVSSFKTFLNENSLDPSICDTIKKYYDEEKEIKKASYMKQLTN